MVALVGTPRAWQAFSNIFAALQHKTQNKLLSMAVNSQVQERGEEVLAGTPLAAEHLASCTKVNPFQIAEVRKPVSAPTARKLRAERRVQPGSDNHSLRAADTLANKSLDVTLPRPEESLAWVSENRLEMHPLASVPRELLDKSNVMEFVTLPKVNAVPAIFAGKEVDLIKLKKSLEEMKAARQKTRYVIIRNLPASPTT